MLGQWILFIYNMGGMEEGSIKEWLSIVLWQWEVILFHLCQQGEIPRPFT